jgi:DNA polymerase-3 subunit beta
MKIICLKENLKNGLAAAERIIGKSLTLPILNNLLLATDKGRVKISSTNLEIGINYWIAGKIEKEGTITVPAKVLSSFVGGLPNTKVEIESKDGDLRIKCDNFKAKIKGQSAQDFPIIPQVQPQAIVEINAEKFKTGLTQVAGTAAISEIRPEISGVLLSFSKESLKIAATDSFRLAEKTIIIKSDFEGSIIVPQRTCMELVRALGEKVEIENKDSVFKVIIGAGQVMFDLGYIQLVSRLIDGQYPPYQQIIPNSSVIKAVLDKEELIKAVRAASFFSSRINDIQFNINSQEKEIEIITQNADVGENKVKIPAQIEGKNLKIAFNWRYILDGLNNISSDNVLLGMNSGSSAAVLSSAGDDNYVYVIMPINAS